ncbi:MAG: hypothetical protein FWB77_04085 [Treponema sp.]|nr:hypothetical protein [Treponema sp.]
MKKRFLMAGIVGVLLALTLVFSGCDLLEPDQPGTIILRNTSTFTYDSSISGYLLYYSDGSTHSYGTCYRNSTLTFNDVPIGTNFRLRVTDGYYDTYYTLSFSLSSGETRTYVFNGYTLSLQ